MAELTLEQKRALALARARVRAAELAARPAPPPKKPEETSFLRDLADVAISGGRSIIDLAKPFAYMAQQGAPTSILPVIAGTVLGESEELLKRGRSAADIQREQIRQRTIAEEAKAPGALARGLSGARQIIEGPKRPAAAQTPLSGIADFISPARAIASLLPATPEAAQREVSGVTTQFGSPIETAQFFTSQAPATLATIGAGGISRAGALAQGLERAAATKAAQQAAVRTGTTLNATDAGYSAAQDVLAKGGTEEEANRAFTIAATGAALTSAAASKIPGVEQNVFATRPTAPGILRGAARTAAGEAPQEFVEEAGAQLAQNIAKLGTAAETPISEGVLSSGALGVIGGAGIGAGSGALQGALARGEAPPAPVVPPDVEPIRTVTVTYPNEDDPSEVVTRNFDILSEEPDEAGYIKVRDETGVVADIKADDLAELEAASPAYVAQEAAPTPPPAPVVDPAIIRERLRLASGVTGDQNEPPRVRALVNDVATALAEDNPVAAQAAVQSRQRALAEGRMSETTRAQRQAELDEALSIINDYRVEYGRARAAGPARVAAPMAEPESVEQALEQNAELAARDAEAQAKRDSEMQARLRLESALESASLVGQGSPARQAQTERQQIFDAIINDETIENPAAAFRQALRERGYPKPELNASERRQVQARLAFTKPAAIAPYIGEEITPEVIEPQPEPAPIIEGEFTEVPAPPPPTPPEVVAGAAPAQPSPRARLMAGAAIEPGVPAFGIGEPPAPSRMAAGLGGEPQVEADFEARREAREEARQRLIDELEALGFKDITVFVRDLLEGGEASGTYDPMDSIIRVAMSPDGEIMTSVMYHELIHYLKDHGFFTDAEWNAILKFAKRDLVMRGIIEYEYRGKTRADKNEEIVAEAFRSWMSQAKGFQPANSVYAKIRRFLNAIRDFFFSQDLRDAEAVFEAIRNGEFAAREDKGSAKRAAYFAGTADRPGRQRMYAGESITEPREGDSSYEQEERRILGNYLQVANEMEAAGADANTIRVATGWERNEYDGKWRYLQSDQMADPTRMLDDFISDFDYADGAYAMSFYPDGSVDLRDLLKHPELYKLYPEARNIRVYIGRSGGDLQGSYDPDLKSIKIYMDATDPVGTLLHEVQHWVQDKEGFAFGSSPSTVWNALTDEQKRSEAQNSVDVLNGDLDDLSQVLDVLSYLNNDPEFGLAIEDGTALQDLDGFFGKAFDDGLIVDDRIYGLAQSRLEDIVNERQALGLADPSLVSEDLLNELNSISEEINEKTQLLEDIKGGDPTEEGSPAEDAARIAFQEHTRRNVIRYLDTAGEIEARDVEAQRGKSQKELREAGMLASEPRRPSRERAVITYPRGGVETESRAAPPTPPVTEVAPASTEAQTTASVDPAPVRMGRLRRAAMRWRTSAARSNITSQFSGIRAADDWRARSYGVEALPESDSFYSTFETYLAKKNGKMMKFRREYVDPIEDAVSDAIKNGVTLDEINDFIQARGAPERNAGIAEKNKDMPDGGSGITDAKAEAMLRRLQLSGKMRYIDRVAKLHDRLRDKTQQMMVEDGLISAETMADWKRKYPNYTPYKGWAPSGDMTVEGQPDPHSDYGAYEGGRPVYSRVAGVRAKPVKEAKGRSSQAANSLYNMIADAEMFLEMGQRNQVINTVATEYQRDPSAFEGLLTIYDEKNPKIVNGKPVKITDENAYKNGIRAFKNGKPYIIETAPNEEGRATLRAFNNLDPLQLGEWTQKFLKVMSVMRGMHTRFNASFWPREFLRGVWDAWNNVFIEKGRKRSAAYKKSGAMKTFMYSWDPSTMAGVFSHLVNREPGNDHIAFIKALTEEMVVNGGAAGQEFAERAERVAKRMESELKRLTATGIKAGYFETKEGLNKLMKAVDGINDFVDLVPRVAAYRALTEAGLTPKEAAQISLRVTLDLTKMGRFGRIIDGVFWWTTPSLTNLTRKVTSLDSSTYRKMVIAQLAIGFALGVLNQMNAPDSDDDGEDDYSQLPEWRKLAYLHVYYSPDEKPFTMPLGFLFLFERYVGGKMAEVLAGKTSDGKAAVDILTAGQQIGAAFLSSLSPVIRSTEARTLAPTSVAPMYDLAINESFFKAPIYNEPFDESVAQASRAKMSTPDIYKKIAQGLQEATGGYGRVKGGIDVSPDQLKYFVDQYTGGVGRLVGGAADGDIETLKKLNPFYFDPKLVEYGSMSRFYERQPYMKRAVAADKLAEEGDATEKEFLENNNPVVIDPTVLDAYKSAENELKELRKDANEMDPDEYRSRQLEIMSSFNSIYNDAKRGQ